MFLASFVQKNKDEKWFKDSVEIFAAASKAVNTPALTEEEKLAKSQKLREYSKALGGLLSRV